MSDKLPLTSLFKELGDFDLNTGTTRMVCVDEFVDKYAPLIIKNGGSWCRLDSEFGCKFKIFQVKVNGTTRFSWDPSDEEKESLNLEKNAFQASDATKRNGNAIYLLKMCGFNDKTWGRPIRTDIRNAFKDQPCVACGSHSHVEVDHKNGLYNDSRVLCAETQLLTDFQSLCKHCNDQKRQTIKWTKNTGKRYGAMKIPMLAVFGKDFVSGDDTFDPNDIEAMNGTFWFDPVIFMTMLKVSEEPTSTTPNNP
jgi:hypothetical protein